jgi:hypothetical protein
VAGGICTGSSSCTVPSSGVINIPAGGDVQSADTGTPTLTWGTSKITANQPLNIGVTSNQIVTGTTTNLTTLTFPAPSGGVTLTFPITSELMLGANSDTTTTHVAHSTAVAGVVNMAAIASADISTALTTPGAIGGTTPAAGSFTTLTGTTYNTTTRCAAAGTGANPSAVACSAAPSGSFSCATNASAGTCVVSTTAVTANSAIFVQPDSSLGSLLSVTCNTTADTALTAPRVSARSAGSSFTITLGTFSTNPLCFSYWIAN